MPDILDDKMFDKVEELVNPPAPSIVHSDELIVKGETPKGVWLTLNPLELPDYAFDDDEDLAVHIQKCTGLSRITVQRTTKVTAS